MRARFSMLTAMFVFILVGRVEADEASHRLAIRSLFQLMNMEVQMNATVDTMLKSQLDVNPALGPLQSTFKEFFVKYIGWRALEAEYVALYMRTFTEAEIKEMIAFYQTPTGKKAIREMPKLMQAGAEIGQQRLKEHMPELMQALQKREMEGKAPTPAPLSPGTSK